MRPATLKTEKSFAKFLGVTPETLTMWKYQPGFHDAVFGYAKAIIGDRMGDLLMAVLREALKGKVSAQKLALQIMGVHHDKVVHDIKKTDRLVIVMNEQEAKQLETPDLEAPSLVEMKEEEGVFVLME